MMLVLLVIDVLSAVSASAGTWRDDFEAGNVDGWTPRGRHTVWETKDGFLHATMEPPKGLPEAADFVEWVAFHGPYERLTITLTLIGEERRNLDLGLGKLLPPGPFACHYVSDEYRIRAMRIALNGTLTSGWAAVEGWVPRNPGTIWDEPKPQRLTVRFDAGHF